MAKCKEMLNYKESMGYQVSTICGSGWVRFRAATHLLPQVVLTRPFINPNFLCKACTQQVQSNNVLVVTV